MTKYHQLFFIKLKLSFLMSIILLSLQGSPVMDITIYNATCAKTLITTYRQLCNDKIMWKS